MDGGRVSGLENYLNGSWQKSASFSINCTGVGILSCQIMWLLVRSHLSDSLWPSRPGPLAIPPTLQERCAGGQCTTGQCRSSYGKDQDSPQKGIWSSSCLQVSLGHVWEKARHQFASWEPHALLLCWGPAFLSVCGRADSLVLQGHSQSKNPRPSWH